MKMKFYNPFKPHIVKNGHGYFVRKLRLFGDKFYLDITYSWENFPSISKYSQSYEEARYLMTSYACYVHNKKLEVMWIKGKLKETVIHGKPE